MARPSWNQISVCIPVRNADFDEVPRALDVLRLKLQDIFKAGLSVIVMPPVHRETIAERPTIDGVEEDGTFKKVITPILDVRIKPDVEDVFHFSSPWIQTWRDAPGRDFFWSSFGF